MMSPKRLPGRSFVLVLICLLASSCAQRAPASPDSLYTTIEDGSIVFFRWKDGPTVMICSDIQAGATSSGENISGPPWLRKEEGFISSVDGRRLDWQVETTAGRSVKCRLDGKEYDLAKGTLFLVKTKGGKTEMEQLSRDLSAVQPDSASCKDFARKDAAVSKLLETAAD
jgi:hypothetical protein